MLLSAADNLVSLLASTLVPTTVPVAVALPLTVKAAVVILVAKSAFLAYAESVLDIEFFYW